ncbi:hypothetical protein HN51_024468 [Arachis hypogaea]
MTQLTPIYFTSRVSCSFGFSFGFVITYKLLPGLLLPSATHVATHVAAAPASVTATAFDRLKLECNLDKLFHLLNANAISIESFFCFLSCHCLHSASIVAFTSKTLGYLPGKGESEVIGEERGSKPTKESEKGREMQSTSLNISFLWPLASPLIRHPSIAFFNPCHGKDMACCLIYRNDVEEAEEVALALKKWKNLSGFALRFESVEGGGSCSSGS